VTGSKEIICTYRFIKLVVLDQVAKNVECLQRLAAAKHSIRVEPPHPHELIIKTRSKIHHHNSRLFNACTDILCCAIAPGFFTLLLIQQPLEYPNPNAQHGIAVVLFRHGGSEEIAVQSIST
jgi:hypothetical protein